MGLAMEDKNTNKKSNPNGANCVSSSWQATMKPVVDGGVTGIIKVFPGMLAWCGAYYLTPVVARLRHGEDRAAQIKKQFKSETFRGPIKTMPIHLLCEFTTTGARLGSFEILRREAIASNDWMPLGLHQEALCALAAGVITCCFTGPLHLSRLLWRRDANIPAEKRINYRNQFHALHHIVAKEGMSGLWKGAGPHMKISILLDLGMLAAYYPSKDYFKETVGCSEVAAILGACSVSQLLATAFSTFYFESMLQAHKMKPNSSELSPYINLRQSPHQHNILKAGFPSILRVFPMLFIRNTPLVTVTWLIYELVKNSEKPSTCSSSSADD